MDRENGHFNTGSLCPDTEVCRELKGCMENDFLRRLTLTIKYYRSKGDKRPMPEIEEQIDECICELADDAKIKAKKALKLK